MFTYIEMKVWKIYPLHLIYPTNNYVTEGYKDAPIFCWTAIDYEH